jgi:hypothetical protein
MLTPDNIKRTKEIASGLIRIAEKASICVLVFLAVFVFNTLINMDRRMTQIESKMDDDRSQWKRLQEHDERLMGMEVQIRVMRELDKLKREMRFPPPPAADDDDDKPEVLVRPPRDEIMEKLDKLKHKESLDDYRNRHMIEQRQAPSNLQAPTK